MNINKDDLRKQFSADWEKHYKVQSLIDRGFTRKKCSACSRMFWSIGERDCCGDSACIGYQFIGKSPVKKKLGYVDTWKAIEKYFKKNDHGVVKPYPSVARWRDDLYFTIASISDFQPYVVNGELDPPHNPLIVPQVCIRFPDISNVGVTGRHYTNFVMFGQHAFNNDRTGLFYWKDEAITHDLNYLKALGIPEKEIIFQEDVWVGGGNFGPCIEYFVGGLELGNCVFMQYEQTPSGSRELKTKVIDMGAGLERLSWITSGDLTSYESTFGPVITSMKKMAGLSIPEDLFEKYAKISGGLDEDEVDDIDAEKERIAKMLGISRKELFENLEPLHALYASADHLKTLLFSATDGMLPSNAGGGYNIRMILRRVFGFAERYSYELDYPKIIEEHASHISYIFPHLKEGVQTTCEVIDEEERKYLATKEKARLIVSNLVKKAGSQSGGASDKKKAHTGSIGSKELMTLYKSHGIPPEYVSTIAAENGIDVKLPGNFYKQVRQGEGEVVKKPEPTQKVLASDLVDYPKTETLFYSIHPEFEARVLGVVYSDYVILDRTAFYPEGGGQISDTGSLGSAKVTYVAKKAGVVLHKVDDVSKIKVGSALKGSLDLGRRKTISRNHTVTHIVNAACRMVLGNHVWQAGAYKDEEKGHLDITHFRRLTNDEISLIEKKVNGFIMDNHLVQTEVLPRNVAEEKYGFRLYQGGAVPGATIRVVSIGNIDHQACGGTHQMIGSTGEIGCFKIVKRESVQDGIERLVYKTGYPAVAYMQEQEMIIRDACSVLSVSDHELVRSVERFFKEWKEQRKQIESMSARLMQDEASRIISEFGEKPVIRVVGLPRDMLQKLGAEIAKSSAAACVMNKDGDIVCACGKDSGFEANELLKKAVSKLGGGGGGSPRIAQGKVKDVGVFEV
jgi:alanyl-tRNA synthetase